MKIISYLSGLLIISAFALCQKPGNNAASTHRIFKTSFESVSDFSNFYIVPQQYMNSCSHEQSTEQVHTGTYSHKAWIYATNPESNITQNNNHRGYPTIQFQKTAQGVFHTPCYISFWVWVDMQLTAHSPENQWLSFATFTTDTSNQWTRTILANLSYDGYAHLMHVPLQGQKDWLFQTTAIMFPQRQWVKLKIFLDTRPGVGYAKLWQDDTLVSYSKIADGNGLLAQAHFGLYAAPSVASGVIYNDDLEIKEVDGE